MSHFTEYQIEHAYTPYIDVNTGYNNSIAYVNRNPGIPIFDIIDLYHKKTNKVMPALGLNKPGIIGHDGVGRPIYEIYTYVEAGYVNLGDILSPLFYPNLSTDVFIIDARATIENGFPATDDSLPGGTAVSTHQLWGWTADAIGTVAFVNYLGDIPTYNGRAIIRFKKTASVLIS